MDNTMQQRRVKSLKFPTICTIVALITCATSLGVSASDAVPIKVSTISDSLHLLTGRGGNIVVMSGKDGVFMVDDQYATQVPEIQKALKSINVATPKFLFNTHWHADHSGGNEAFGTAGAIVFSHANVRKRMSSEQFMAFFKRATPASPEKAWPILTFTDELSLYVNNEEIEIVHAPNAHTDGDSIVFFKMSNVVHMGDVFFHGMYPFIDTSSGGTIGGVITAVESVLEKIDDTTTVIPGHGPIADKSALREYASLLTRVRKSVSEHIVAGMSADQVVTAKPTKDFDSSHGGGFLGPEKFTRMVYDNIVSSTLKPKQ